MLPLRAVATALLLACASGGINATSASPRVLPPYVRYLVLGAGPGGLQIAHYLESAGRDYLVLDRASAPASFFATYPRFRQLISINKRHVGREDSLDFAQRHDWNSLLSEASHVRRSAPASSTDARLHVASVAPRLRFTSWSREYYPPAALLREYLAEWAAANASSAGLGRERPLRIAFGAEVARVGRPLGWADGKSSNGGSGSSAEARFLVTLARGAGAVACRSPMARSSPSTASLAVASSAHSAAAGHAVDARVVSAPLRHPFARVCESANLGRGGPHATR